MKKTILACGFLVMSLALLAGCYPYEGSVDLGAGYYGYPYDPYGYGPYYSSYPYFYPSFSFSYYYPYYPYYYPYYSSYRGARYYPYYPSYRGSRYYPYNPYYGSGRSYPYYFSPPGGRQFQGTRPGGTGGRTPRR